MDGPLVIRCLQVAVAAVTAILAAALVALARGDVKLHGRLNLLFFTLTLAAVVLFEVVIRIVNPGAFDYIKSNAALSRALNIHLCFSVPALLLMPAMLYTGLTKRRRTHIALAVLFSIAWLGTFVTGIFFLPLTADG